MKKFTLTSKITATLLALCCLTTVTNAYYSVSLSNFEKTKNYTEGIFSDVSSEYWFSGNVASAYEYELMNGKGDGIFDPFAKMNIAETITIAVRIYYIYFNGVSIYFDDVEDGYWYDPYVNYASIQNIATDQYPDYTAPATRAQFAQILAASVDSADLEAINIVDDGAIPDVPMTADYADSVYLLYRAGVLSGSDELGTFMPDSTITRAEAAAIITRIIDPTLRKTIELAGEY